MGMDEELDTMLFAEIALKIKRKKKRKMWVRVTPVNVLEFNALLEKINLPTEKRISSKFWNYLQLACNFQAQLFNGN